MNTAHSSIFSVLSKFATRQEENYLTESFAFLLKELLRGNQDCPNCAVSLLNKICPNKSYVIFHADEDIKIETQNPEWTSEEGEERGQAIIPDITITAPGKLVFIEVKDASPVSEEQIVNYKEKLTKEYQDFKVIIILISRYSKNFDEHASPDRHVLWREIYSWLRELAPDEPVGTYLVKCFREFLEEKKMTIQKVGWEYINGIPAMLNLVEMISAALDQLETGGRKKSIGEEWSGFYLDNKQYWCGVYYQTPTKLLFQLRGKDKFDKNAVAQPSFPPLEDYDNGYQFFLDLEDEKTHFFSRDVAGQMGLVNDFVKKCYEESP